MAMEMEKQQEKQQEKHLCRICGKGFSSGRALGGHMRSHGINEETDGDSSPRSANECGNQIYQLRSNFKRSSFDHYCHSCKKDFNSWKNFVDHACCTSNEDALGNNDDPSPHSSHKRKRHCENIKSIDDGVSEEEYLAHCLVLLSADKADRPVPFVSTEESSASPSKNDGTILATEHGGESSAPPQIAAPNQRGMFECKACKKVFVSHQALGGHRASHKKVKGCFAAKLEPEEAKINRNLSPQPEGMPRKKAKVHECTICHRQFATGQALGGHKRCHWINSNPNAPAIASSSRAVQFPHELALRPIRLDLNMPPAPADNLDGILDPPTVKWNIEAPIMAGCSHYDVKTVWGEDEAESEMKKATDLSDLKDVNVGGETSPWLQVGIGSISHN